VELSFPKIRKFTLQARPSASWNMLAQQEGRAWRKYFALEWPLSDTATSALPDNRFQHILPRIRKLTRRLLALLERNVSKKFFLLTKKTKITIDDHV